MWMQAVLFPIWGNSVSVLARLQPWRSGFDSRRREEFIVFARAWNRLWDPPASCSVTTEIPKGKASGPWKLTTQLHLLPRLRMGGAMPPPPRTSSLSTDKTFLASARRHLWVTCWKDGQTSCSPCVACTVCTWPHRRQFITALSCFR